MFPRSTLAAALALLGGLTGAAGATDLGLDPSRFFIVQQTKNVQSPVYQVLPTGTGATPFNQKQTAFLLPCGVQSFGGQLRVTTDAPVYPQIGLRLVRTDDTAIVSHGASGTATFDELTADLSLVQPGAPADAGFTAVSNVSVFKGWLFQPKDLPANKPVRLELRVRGFAANDYAQSVADSNPDNDVMNLWVTRVCP